MFKNYVKSAWRNLRKHKTFSVINIAGLSIGIAVCFVIMLYVQNELSYDRFNKNAERIVRVVFKARINGGQIFESNVMPPVASAMKNDYPEVLDATRILRGGTPKITYGGKVFKGDELAFVDPNFFQIFTVPLIEGDPNTALQQPNTIIISKEMAQKYFGNSDPIGKILVMPDNQGAAFKVTGLIDKVPGNSHFHFDMFASMKGIREALSDSWLQSNFYTYLLLRPGYDYHKLEAKLPGMVEKYMGPQIQQNMGLSLKDFITRGNKLGFELQPLTSIHLHSHASFELSPPGNATYVYIFGAIALFMLLIACVNFINLSTASASKRAKEVGVRKVIGSGKNQLVKQFMLESVLLVFCALLIAFFLVVLSVPLFNQISGKSLSFEFNFKIVADFVALGILVSLISGLYPAFYLSSFKPAAVLKGTMSPSKKNIGLRGGLVVFQFFISVSLIIGTLVVWQQMRFIQHKDLGYDKEHLLTIPNSYLLGKNEKVYEEEMRNDPRILNATVSQFSPAGPSGNNNALAYPEGHDHQIMKTLEYHVDEDYIPTLGMKMASGRNFSRDFSTDSTAMILNQTAARAFGWNDQKAIGKIIVRENSDRGKDVPFHIVGVVKDFNFKSLHEPITPLLMTLEPGGGLIFKIRTANMPALLALMKKKWDEFNTGEPFTYAFMNDLYDKTYSSEQRTGTILNIFSILTILVACLGLFGLVTYSSEQRTKEIGVRKVLGSSISGIVAMLSKEFARLVLISTLVAFPVAWWAMNRWLQSFAYRIQVGWWIFAVAGLGALVIAMVTVSFQSIKAAAANPVKSLRTE